MCSYSAYTLQHTRNSGQSAKFPKTPPGEQTHGQRLATDVGQCPYLSATAIVTISIAPATDFPAVRTVSALPAGVAEAVAIPRTSVLLVHRHADRVPTAKTLAVHFCMDLVQKWVRCYLVGTVMKAEGGCRSHPRRVGCASSVRCANRCTGRFGRLHL